MPDAGSLSRRSFLLGAAALGLAACSKSKTGALAGPSPSANPLHCAALNGSGPGQTLWAAALRRGILYGSTTATWQISDKAYAKLFSREAAILSTEDDFLWYRVRPSPTSGLKFKYSDEIVAFAEHHGMLMFGAHLVWDQGFGTGWKESDLFAMDAQEARKMLWGTVDALVKRYRGKIAVWSVANEVLDSYGLRTDVPWYRSLGPNYVSEAFHRVRDSDPKATLLLNDYGYENDQNGSLASDKRTSTLEFLDQLLKEHVPVDGLGIQAHLNAGQFQSGFDPKGYLKFLSEVADRGLKILITELDVLDDGLPANKVPRDRAVADIYRRYLDTALQEPRISSVITFGLSDRYTWLQEDYPRQDGAPRRPLAFDQNLKPKPALQALSTALAGAPVRSPVWIPPLCDKQAASA